MRLGAAVKALPRAIPLRTSGTVACPSCDGGVIHYARWHRGAEIACSTPNCCEAHFSIEAGKEWPSQELEPPANPERFMELAQLPNEQKGEGK